MICRLLSRLSCHTVFFSLDNQAGRSFQIQNVLQLFPETLSKPVIGFKIKSLEYKIGWIKGKQMMLLHLPIEMQPFTWLKHNVMRHPSNAAPKAARVKRWTNKAENYNVHTEIIEIQRTSTMFTPNSKRCLSSAVRIVIGGRRFPFLSDLFIN